MEEFAGFIKIKITDNEIIEEGRPKLIKWKIKKNNVKWSAINLSTGKHYFIKMCTDEKMLINRMHEFLNSISAYDEYSLPRTNGPVNRLEMAKSIVNSGYAEIWIPANREGYIAKAWDLTARTNESKEPEKKRNRDPEDIKRKIANDPRLKEALQQVFSNIEKNKKTPKNESLKLKDVMGTGGKK